ncbi:MAG: ribulose-phosphate 3-epimerase [Clostridia bacterium]|nr:ribulose-phosphate 3-epimerase [Clostridia bacterium]
MIEILSSILASDVLNMGADVRRMQDAGVDSLHVDIMDAHFVPNLSFGPAVVSALKKAFPNYHQDVHLMMDNPEKYIAEFVKNGAGAITVHAEIPGDVKAILQDIKARGVKAGVSVKPRTEAEAIRELLPLCDLVLVMTVEPGFGGQKFMPDMMPKIRALREMGYKGQIMVDGGINAETAKEAVAAGADALVMGTALLKADDPAAVVRACKELGE